MLQVSVILYAPMPKTLGPEYRGSAFCLFSWWQDCISVQWEHRRQGVPKRMLTAFSGSTGDSQPSPCGLVILRLGRLDGPLEFSACGRASGKADGAAFLAGKQGG